MKIAPNNAGVAPVVEALRAAGAWEPAHPAPVGLAQRALSARRPCPPPPPRRSAGTLFAALAAALIVLLLPQSTTVAPPFAAPATALRTPVAKTPAPFRPRQQHPAPTFAQVTLAANTKLSSSSPPARRARRRSRAVARAQRRTPRPVAIAKAAPKTARWRHETVRRYAYGVVAPTWVEETDAEGAAITIPAVVAVPLQTTEEVVAGAPLPDSPELTLVRYPQDW